MSDWRIGTWACLDLETTGLGEDDRICEIALVTLREGKVVDVFASLVNPGRPIPPEAASVHGITDDKVIDAPTIEQLRIEVLHHVARADVVVGYNLFGADEQWLERELPGVLDGKPKIDPLVLVRDRRVGRYWKSDHAPDLTCPLLIERREAPPRRKSHGRHALSRAAYELGCDGPEEGFEEALHRAAWDALLSGRIGWALRRWCGLDVAVTERNMRREAARYQSEIESFKARMACEDAEKAAAVEARRRGEIEALAAAMSREIEALSVGEAQQHEADRRLIAALQQQSNELAESLREAQARVDELEAYVVKVDAALGRSAYAGGS